MKQAPALRLAGLTFGATAAVMAASLVGSILLARFLGPEGRGALAALLFWPHLFAGIGSLSVNEALVKRIASTPVEDHEHLLRVSLALTLVLSLATVAVGVVVTPWLLGADRAGLIDITRLYFVVFVPVSIAGLCLLSYQQGALNFGRFNQLRLLQPAAYLTGLIVIALAGSVSVESVTIVTLLSAVVGTALSWSWAGRPAPQWNAQTGAGIVRLGAQYHGVNLVMLLATEIDRLVVLRWTADHDVGLYAVATAVAMLGAGVIGQTASAVLFPKIAGLTDESARRALFCRSTRMTVSLTLAVNGTIALLVPILIPLVFGAAFQPAIVVTQALLLGHSIKTVRGVMDRSMRAAGIVSAGFFAEIATTAVFLATVGVCFARYGLTGVAFALTSGQLAGLLVIGYVVYRRLGLSPAQWLIPGLPTLREMRETLNRQPSK